MRKKLFDLLVDSVKEAGRIHRDEIPPSCKFVFEPMNIKKIRRRRNRKA